MIGSVNAIHGAVQDHDDLLAERKVRGQPGFLFKQSEIFIAAKLNYGLRQVAAWFEVSIRPNAVAEIERLTRRNSDGFGLDVLVDALDLLLRARTLTLLHCHASGHGFRIWGACYRWRRGRIGAYTAKTLNVSAGSIDHDIPCHVLLDRQIRSIGRHDAVTRTQINNFVAQLALFAVISDLFH